LAGRVKEKYPADVEVEVIYPDGSLEDVPKPPNIAVDDELLGSKMTFEDLEEIVLEKLGKVK